MIERTLLLVKPDGVYRSLVGRIISKIEDAGLKVVAIKIVKADRKIAGEHYIEYREWMVSVGNKTIASYKEKGTPLNDTALEIGMRIRNFLIEYLVSGPVVPMVIEGNEAISIVRKLTGATEPKRADPSSLRGMYCSDSYQFADDGKRPIRNLVHASEDKKTADREIAVWFKNKELVEYKRADETAMY